MYHEFRALLSSQAKLFWSCPSSHCMWGYEMHFSLSFSGNFLSFILLVNYRRQIWEKMMEIYMVLLFQTTALQRKACNARETHIQNTFLTSMREEEMILCRQLRPNTIFQWFRSRLFPVMWKHFSFNVKTTVTDPEIQEKLKWHGNILVCVLTIQPSF